MCLLGVKPYGFWLKWEHITKNTLPLFTTLLNMWYVTRRCIHILLPIQQCHNMCCTMSQSLKSNCPFKFKSWT
jgi:hypothetical protein